MSGRAEEMICRLAVPRRGRRGLAPACDAARVHNDEASASTEAAARAGKHGRAWQVPQVQHQIARVRMRETIAIGLNRPSLPPSILHLPPSLPPFYCILHHLRSLTTLHRPILPLQGVPRDD